MADLPEYSDGTISVTNGSKTITGVGTAWDLFGLNGGWLIIDGVTTPAQAVKSFESDTSGTLLVNWPGSTLSDASYWIVPYPSTSAEARTAITKLAEIAQLTRIGYVPIEVQATGSLAERDAFDDELKGFHYERIDVNPPIIYVKLSDDNADWSDGWSPKGDTGAPGTDGEPGKVADYAGSGVPDSGLGSDGETYIDLDNGDTYKKDSGSWVHIGSVQGHSADLLYTFSDTTTMADPGTGILRCNNASLSSVTAIAFDDLSSDEGNPDISAYINSWDSPNNPNRGELLIRKHSAHENFALYKVTGVTDNSGWSEVAVEYIAGYGTLSDTDKLHVAFFRSGDNGNVLHSVSGAPSDSLGVDGDYAFDPTALVVYGPKASGSWPGGSSIIAVEYVINLDGGYSNTLYGGVPTIDGGSSA